MCLLYGNMVFLPAYKPQKSCKLCVLCEEPGMPDYFVHFWVTSCFFLDCLDVFGSCCVYKVKPHQSLFGSQGIPVHWFGAQQGS